MADIRINSLPTTASASSSDDFLALDGATNGTRKLNAYSPTFGGNLTVSGTATATNFIPSSGAAASGSIGGSSVYGLEIWGKTGSFSDLIIYNGAGNTLLTNLTGTQNISLAGNLTVSGTGTSAIQGDTINLGAVGNVATVVNLFRNNASVGGMYAGNSDFNLFGGASAASHLVIKSNGNVLIGTTTDTGNGKLQLATHTTSAGGIGFGTDTSLYRSAAGQLRGPSSFIDATFASSGLFFGASMTLQANDNVLIKTNGSVTALTLDTSQNATFAGTILTATNAAKNAIVARYNSSNSLFGVTVNSAGQGVISENNDASTGSDKYSKTGLPAFRLGNTGGSGTVPFWIDVAASGTAGNAITWTNAFQIDSSQNATFAGGIIGMTQGNVDNISDDGVASFTPLYNRGFIVINNPDYSQNALIAYFKAGSSYLLYSITKSADVTLNNSTTLTGTTGTDGKLNIGYNNSIIYIENRLGGIGNFQRYALGGTN